MRGPKLAPSISVNGYQLRARMQSDETDDFGDDGPTPASSSSAVRTVRLSTGSTRSGDDELRRSFDARSFTRDRVSTSDDSISRRYSMGSHEIGVGGYGKVYMAKDKIFKNRQVAIKKMVKMTEDKTQNLVCEVQIMKELDHPNICRLFETYDQDRFMFFVLEYCEGGDLFDRIMEKGKLAEAITSKVMKQVASALMYAHAHGVAHRDLKPENICFCTRDPDSTHIKVIDWGLGKFFQLNSMKSNVGSSTYAAPEVLDAKVGAEGYSSACDLWSLGVVAYISLSGKPPFWGSFHEQIRKMRSETYPMKSDVWMASSNECKEFIQQLLKRDPQERLPLHKLIVHPWISKHCEELDLPLLAGVFEKLEAFSHAPDFFSMLVASVARQLDYKSLAEVQDVFCMLDTNGDGVLDLEEVKAGFEKVLGPGGSQEVEGMFSRLDLDGTDRLSYSEFCAAGIGEESFLEEHVLWAAFKIFDVRDDGRITKEEMQQVLSNADVNKVWSSTICNDVNEIVSQYSQDGTITFPQWMHLMREQASRHSEDFVRRRSQSESEILSGLQKLSQYSSQKGSDADIEFKSELSLANSDMILEGTSEEDSPTLTKVCGCGNVFMPDALFCRKCGSRRNSQGMLKPNSSSSIEAAPTSCLAGVCKGGCHIS